MKKFSIEYKNFLYESLDDKVKDKLSQDYISLKRGILILLENSIDDTQELVNVQNFISEYIENTKDSTLVGLVDDAEIFDFYLKYQGNIDEICADKNYFDLVPKNNNIFSLYNFIGHGTKFAVKECMKYIQTDLFNKK
ncbi:hypothetical protein M0Q97_07780 [Candidatus Dojkabacteria bacterium]|jgi:hypothetical protein|nr:hypothetical protein [Candidatus Dojkabacteria bacterium]